MMYQYLYGLRERENNRVVRHRAPVRAHIRDGHLDCFTLSEEHRAELVEVDGRRLVRREYRELRLLHRARRWRAEDAERDTYLPPHGSSLELDVEREVPLDGNGGQFPRKGSVGPSGSERSEVTFNPIADAAGVTAGVGSSPPVAVRVVPMTRPPWSYATRFTGRSAGEMLMKNALSLSGTGRLRP